MRVLVAQYTHFLLAILNNRFFVIPFGAGVEAGIRYSAALLPGQKAFMSRVRPPPERRRFQPKFWRSHSLLFGDMLRIRKINLTFHQE
jgi:hypothetical protein